MAKISCLFSSKYFWICSVVMPAGGGTAPADPGDMDIACCIAPAAPSSSSSRLLDSVWCSFLSRFALFRGFSKPGSGSLFCNTCRTQCPDSHHSYYLYKNPSKEKQQNCRTVLVSQFAGWVLYVSIKWVVECRIRPLNKPRGHLQLHDP